MFNPIASAAATATGTSLPGSAEAIIRYMMGRPLDFEPGSRYAYSNFGYNVLGRIIERVSGQSYNACVQTAVFNRAGITRAVLGRTFLADRAPGEVRSYDYPGATLVASALPPTTNRVERPYGNFHLEAMDAHGQWVMNTSDYLRFLASVDRTKSPALLDANSLTQLTARPAAPVSVGAAAYYGAGISVRVWDKILLNRKRQLGGRN